MKKENCALGNKNHRIFQNVKIQTDNTISHRRSDLIIVRRKQKSVKSWISVFKKSKYLK